MILPTRFPYAPSIPGQSRPAHLAYLPLTLVYGERTITVSALLDTGSTVNVLPHHAGLQLGLAWKEQTTSVYLTGALARVPARGVIIAGIVAPFPSVALAFAWTENDDVPVILGQINFFAEFDVCFYRAQSAFEVKPRAIA